VTNSWFDDDTADPGDPPSPASRPSPLMSTREVAELFQRADRTIRWWRRRGLLPEPVPVGRAVFYRRADIEAMIGQVLPPASNE